VALRQALGYATGQQIDLFAKYPKSRSAALYGYRFPMYDGNMAMFGDSAVTRPDPFALMMSNEAFALGQPETRSKYKLSRGINYSIMAISRTSMAITEPIYRANAATAQETLDPLGHYFSSVGVLVSRATANTTQSLSVTIKAGGNKTHSHNDNGSYTIGVMGAQPMGDPGKTVYSAKSFGAERYTISANNSYGHPVPRIDDILQTEASKYTSATPQVQTSADRDTFTLDMRPAYAVPGMQKLLRTLTHQRDKNTLQVQDDFSFDTARAFEVAITSIGKAEKLDDKRWRFTHSNKSVVATVSASAAFTLANEVIDEEGLVFQRLAVRLTSPLKQGYVRIVYSAE
jgi:hypothetical protein